MDEVMSLFGSKKPPAPQEPDYLLICIVIGALLTIFYGLVCIFRHMKNREESMNRHHLHAIGLVLFLPTLLILASTTGMHKETIAAFLGIIAGYLLSYVKDLGGNDKNDKDDGG